MNKTYNQSGEEIISIGQYGSHISNKEMYNITIPKLIALINKNWSLGGVERHTDYNDLVLICKLDHIHPSNIHKLIKTANFYSDLNKDNSIK